LQHLLAIGMGVSYLSNMYVGVMMSCHEKILT